jgi:hypothetical protein
MCLGTFFEDDYFYIILENPNKSGSDAAACASSRCELKIVKILYNFVKAFAYLHERNIIYNYTKSLTR